MTEERIGFPDNAAVEVTIDGTIDVHAPAIPRSSYLFCMKGNRNQKISIALCKAADCKFFQLDDSRPECHCPMSLHYLSALKNISKEDLDKVKKERKVGHTLTDEEMESDE